MRVGGATGITREAGGGIFTPGLDTRLLISRFRED
ncbi:hypothetical protein RV134_350153 [Roseovarius sp. EC-HK134]|nr:hypothetical protein RV420_400433 [Roseovarius sp. EC-SD190]VVT28499.1 hypothetical protein RV134_350153 [Roseovarius sp. EC-HK134]